MKQKNRPAAALPLGLLLIAVALLAANLRAPLAALGPLVGMIQADLRTSGTFMGIAAALPMLAFALFSPFAPKAARRFGMERVLAASLALMIVGLVCRSSGPSESLLAGGTLLVGRRHRHGQRTAACAGKTQSSRPGRLGGWHAVGGHGLVFGPGRIGFRSAGGICGLAMVAGGMAAARNGRIMRMAGHSAPRGCGKAV